MLWFFLGFLGVICGLIGTVIAENKWANAGFGFFLGLLSGPIGLIIAALSDTLGLFWTHRACARDNWALNSNYDIVNPVEA